MEEIKSGFLCYMGDLWQDALTPTGTIVIGELISATFPDGTVIFYIDFDVCDNDGIAC
jgi:hypothetical protein